MHLRIMNGSQHSQGEIKHHVLNFYENLFHRFLTAGFRLFCQSFQLLPFPVVICTFHMILLLCLILYIRLDSRSSVL